jgi:transglutaminase-like putative cysteine protease
MPQLYKILTFVLAFTGCISIVISGEVKPLMYITGAGLLPGYYRFLKGMPQAPRWVIGGFSVLTLMIFLFDSLIISNDIFIGVAHLTITFQAIKSFDLKKPWDHLQVYFMSLLQLIIASELTYSIAFGVIFIFFLVALVTAIILAHFIKEGSVLKVGIRKPVAYISALTLLITVVFFISAPRISGGIWSKGYKKSIRTVGFSEKVDFGSFGDVKLDPTVVMRVEMGGDFKGLYYWRGMTLNYFDGVSWKDTLKEKKWIYKTDDRFEIKPLKKDQVISQRIFLEPMDTDVVFGLSDIAAVEAMGRILFMDDAGSLFLPFKKGKRFNYIAYSIDRMPAVTENKVIYLQLPSGIEKISKFALDLTGKEQKDIDKTLKIEKYLRENYAYSLSLSQPPEGTSPMEDFLFSSKKGFCEHYATAMVLMLRSVNIPARIVTGFLGGEINEYGGYIIVRQSNAHSWVEAMIDGAWRRFDPTPQIPAERQSATVLLLDMIRMKWSRYVVAFSASDQKEIVRIFTLPFRLSSMPDIRIRGSYGILYILMLGAAILLSPLLIRKMQFRRYGFATAEYLRLRNLFRKRGAEINPSLTPAEVKREASRFNMDGKVEEFISLYEEYRFGGRKMGKEDMVRYRRLIEEIKKQFR